MSNYNPKEHPREQGGRWIEVEKRGLQGIDAGPDAELILEEDFIADSPAYDLEELATERGGMLAFGEDGELSYSTSSSGYPEHNPVVTPIDSGKMFEYANEILSGEDFTDAVLEREDYAVGAFLTSDALRTGDEKNSIDKVRSAGEELLGRIEDENLKSVDCGKGFGVRVSGAKIWVDWDKEKTRNKISSIVAAESGLSVQTTRALMDDMDNYVTLPKRGMYKVSSLRSHKLNPSDFASEIAAKKNLIMKLPKTHKPVNKNGIAARIANSQLADIRYRAAIVNRINNLESYVSKAPLKDAVKEYVKVRSLVQDLNTAHSDMMDSATKGLKPGSTIKTPYGKMYIQQPPLDSSRRKWDKEKTPDAVNQAVLADVRKQGIKVDTEKGIKALNGYRKFAAAGTYRTTIPGYKKLSEIVPHSGLGLFLRDV